jgi:hypothetical protein
MFMMKDYREDHAYASSFPDLFSTVGAFAVRSRVYTEFANTPVGSAQLIFPL